MVLFWCASTKSAGFKPAANREKSPQRLALGRRFEPCVMLSKAGVLAIMKEVLTMAGISATLSREDLEFMADDIGRELMAFLPLEERLAGASAEELLTVLTPEKRKRLLELLLKMSMSTAVEKNESNGSSSN